MRFLSLLLAGMLGGALISQGQDLPAGQTKEAKPPKKITILPIPVLFYQQETGWGYGLGGLLSGRLGSDTTTRASNARVQYWTTQQSQSLLQLVHTIYAPGEKFYLNGEISAYKNRLYYFGVGNNVSSSNRSFVDFNLFIINQRLEKGIAPNQFLGLQYRLSRVYQIEAEPGRVNDDGDNIPVTDPANLNQRNYFLIDPRLDARQRQNFSASGIGPGNAIARDIRLAEMLIAKRACPPIDKLAAADTKLKALLAA